MIQNILAIFLKFGNTFLFVFLQLICLYCIVNHNETQSAIWFNSSSLFVGKLYEKYDNFIGFVDLRKENERLANENAELRESLLKRNYSVLGIDSLLAYEYEFIPAIIVNNSINKINNRLTLNRGSSSGIIKGMGVLSNDGVVGVVSSVGKHYCTVNSILSISTNVSAVEKRTNSLGVVNWDGSSPNKIQMNSVPQYIPINIGDTIITSGFSTVFPRGHIIGMIEEMEKNVRTGYYDIELKLNNNLSQLQYVNIVRNKVFKEIQELQKKAESE